MARRRKKKRSKLSRLGDVIIILIIIGLLAAAGWLLYKEFFPNNTPVLKMQVMEKTDTGEEAVNWDKLRAVNPEVVGWLKIEGTNIDTPIVQTTDNDKYLYTSFDGNQDERGVPFLDADYKWNPKSRNAVIYGHSTMRSRVHVMFDDLLFYHNDPNFINQYHTIEFDRPPELGGDGTWEIVAVIVEEADYDYRQLDFADENTFVNYYADIKAKSIVQTDAVVAPGDEILTLSTCIFNVGLNDGRLAVIAKRVA